MPMVRKNPMPAGRYWIDITAASRDIWDLFVKKNADIITIEKDEPDTWLPGFKSVWFVVFTLKDKTIWPRGVGFPDTMETWQKERTDVHQRGPIPTPGDVWDDITHTAAEKAQEVLTGAAILAAIWWFSQRKDRR